MLEVTRGTYGARWTDALMATQKVNEMANQNANNCEREYDFALIVAGISELTDDVLDALFEAGCDDATPSIHYGLLYMEFSRSAVSLQEAIITAIRDVLKAGVDARVLRVDECNLVTQSDIARKIGRSRQLVHQYMTGERGPGGFPPPACYISDRSPLWAWCAVSYWLAGNNLIRPEESWNAAVVEAINSTLGRQMLPPELVEQVSGDLRELGISSSQWVGNPPKPPSSSM